MSRFEVIASATFIAGLIILIPEIDHIDNTHRGTLLFFMSGIVAATCSFLLLLPLILGKKFRRTARSDRSWHWHLAAILVGIAFLTATGVSYVNRTWAGAPRNERFLVVNKGESAASGRRSRGKQWYLFLRVREGQERLVVPRSVWETVEVGSYYVLEVRPGLLGYDYVVVPHREGV